MALNLSELKFVVDDSDLKRASDTIGNLVTNVGKLDKAARDAAQTEATLARAAKDNAKANLDNAKAQDVRLKSTIAADKADQQATTAIEKKTKATEKVNEAVNKNVGVLQRQKDILEFQTQGFSKGQSSILAYGKAAGLAADDISELGKVLETQRKLMGGDPFDKSLSGLKSLQNQYTELKESVRQYATDSNLTAKQARELARDKERLIEKMKVEGASFSEIRKAVRAHNAEYVNLATSYNKMTSAEDAVIKSRKEAVNATNYLTQADQKMAAALNTSNAALDKAGTDSLVKYETALRKSGISQDVATAKLAKYKAQLEQVQIQEQKRIEQHLTRALAPQATDVVVSLWSGQNPLTVLLQQGGQITDLFMQSGVAAEKFGEVVKSSMQSMLPSILAVVKGVGGLLVDGLTAAGNAVLGFVGKVTGMSGALDGANKKLMDMGWTTAAAGVRGLGILMSTVFATGAGAMVAGLVAIGVALKQTISENDKMAVSLGLTGAAMGLTFSTATDLSKSMQGIGVSTSDAMKVLSEMAKQGKLTSEDVMLVTKAAVDMKTYAGVAIEDTVKQFVKMKEKPVEAMIELARATGLVAPEVVKAIMELEDQGRIAEATSRAIEELARVNDEQVERMKESYNGFSLFMIDLGKGISKFFSDAFKDLFYAASPTEQLKTQLKAVDKTLNNWGTMNMDAVGAIQMLIPGEKERLQLQRTQLLNQIALLDQEKQQYEVIQKEKQDRIAILGLEKSVSDELSKRDLKRSRKKDNLQDFTSNFIEEKVKEVAKSKNLDIETIKSNDALMESYKKLAQVEWESAQEKPKKDPSENYYATLMREATASSIKAEDATKSLTASQVKLLEAVNDPRFLKLSKVQQETYLSTMAANAGKEQQIALTDAQSDAEERLLKLLGKSSGIGRQYYTDMANMEKDAALLGKSREEIEELTRAIFMATPAWKAYEKALEDVKSAARKFNEDSIASQAATLKENESLDYRISLLGKTTEEQKALSAEYNRANKIADVRIKLAKQLRDIEADIEKAKKDGLPEEKYKNLIDAQVQARKDAAEQEKVINREVAVQYAEDLQKEIDAIRNGITDSIVTALFEGGKAGSEKLRNLIVDQLKKPVTMVVNAVVNTLFGSVLGSLFGGGGGAAAAAAGGSNIVSMASNGLSLANMVTSGYAGAIGSAVGSIFGQTAGNAALASSLGLGSSSAAAAASGASVAAGGTGAGAGLGASIGAAVPYVAIAAIVATSWKKLFGRELKDSGIQGEFGGDTGFEGQQYKFYKGGLFRSDKTKYSPLDEAIRKTLGDSFNLMKKQIIDFADILGLNSEKLKDFTTSIKLSLHGLSEQEANTKIQEALATANNEMAEQILGTWSKTTKEVTEVVETAVSGEGSYFENITRVVEEVSYTASPFAREGEKAIDTLTRLATSLSTVNQVFDTLGYTLYDASLAGGDLSSKLIDLFGNIDGFVKSTTFYYENFYTEAERQQTTLRQLTAEFSKHNLALPKTREEYRKLVEAQDLATEEGRKMYAWLLQLTPAFAGITEAVGETVTEVQSLTKAERERMQAAREAANKLVEEQTKSFKSLQDNLSKETFKSKGGMAYGFNVSISEVQSSEKFITTLDSATASLAELEKLNLGDEFEKYASEIGKIVQGTKELFAAQLANSRLAQGDVSGAIQAKMGASQLNYSDFTKDGQFNAGAFNVAYAREQAIAAKGLVDVANSNALTTANVASVIGQLNAFAQSELILNEIKQGFIQGVREASNTTSTYVVRDAIQGLAGVFAGQQANQQFLNTSTGLPAIAAAYAAAADMQKVQMIDGARYMGEFSISYANAISNLNANFSRGKITTDELEGAVKALEESFGELKDYAVTPVQIAMSGVGASSAIAQEGIKALNLYFGQLTDRAGELAEQAKLASEPIAVVTDVIGRMTSFTDVFATSANAVINGFKGMTGAVGAMSHAIYQMEAEGSILTSEQKYAMMADAESAANMGEQGLKDALTYGSQVRKALLIAQAGSIAGDTLTTSDASKVAEKLQVDPAFAKLTAAGIRDASLLLDGLKQFDANSFEKVFVRISEALNQGALNEEQYAALFDESIKIYTDYDAKIQQVTDSFNALRDAAKSLADQLLIDAGYTTLTGGQTLVESQRQYNELMFRALQGDVTAASQLGGATQSMLTIAKQQATTEQDYARVFGSTIGDLRTVESMPLPARIAEPIQVVGQTNEELIAEIKALREEIRAGNAQIASNTDKTVKSLQDFQVNGLPTTTLV